MEDDPATRPQGALVPRGHTWGALTVTVAKGGAEQEDVGRRRRRENPPPTKTLRPATPRLLSQTLKGRTRHSPMKGAEVSS